MLIVPRWMRTIFTSEYRIQYLDRIEKTKYFQKALFYTWFNLAVFAVIYWISGAYFISGMLIVGTFAISPLIYLLEKNGFHDSARLCFILTGNWYILGTKLGSNNLIATEIWYFSLCLVTLFFFDFNKVKQIATGIIISLGCWLIARSLDADMIPESWRSFNEISPYWNDLNYGANFLFNLVCLKQLYDAHQRFQQYSINRSKYATLGELAAGIVHEINNALTVVQAKVSLLRMRLEKESPKSAPLLQEIQKIDQSTQRIVKIVNGLRAFSRQTQGDPLEKASILEILSATEDICQYRLQFQKIEFTLPKLEKNIIVECRPYQIVQVLLNLINNSIEAIQHQTSPWIRIRCADDEKEVQISVMDSGNGIPSNVVAQMMNPFFSRKPLSQGTGLGLCICHRIMDEHHGQLQYCNSGPNTEFVLILPKSRETTPRQPSQQLESIPQNGLLDL